MSENLVSKAFIEFLIAVSVPSESKFCPDCGTELHHLNSTFFFEEQSWQVPISICLQCQPTEQVAPRYNA